MNLTKIHCNVVNGNDCQEDECVGLLSLSEKQRQTRNYDIYVVSSELSGMEGFTAKLYAYLMKDKKSNPRASITEPSVMFFLDKEEEPKAPSSRRWHRRRRRRSSSLMSSSSRSSPEPSSQMSSQNSSPRPSFPESSSLRLSPMSLQLQSPAPSSRRSFLGLLSQTVSVRSEEGQEVVGAKNQMPIRDFKLATLKSANAFKGSFVSDRGSGTICYKFIIAFKPKYWSIRVNNIHILQDHFEKGKIREDSEDLVFLKWTIGNFVTANSKYRLNLSKSTKYPQPEGSKLTLKYRKKKLEKTFSMNVGGESPEIFCNNKKYGKPGKKTSKLSWDLRPTWIGTNRRRTDSDWIGWSKIPELEPWKYKGNFKEAGASV